MSEYKPSEESKSDKDWFIRESYKNHIAKESEWRANLVRYVTIFGGLIAGILLLILNMEGRYYFLVNVLFLLSIIIALSICLATDIDSKNILAEKEVFFKIFDDDYSQEILSADVETIKSNRIKMIVFWAIIAFVCFFISLIEQVLSFFGFSPIG